MAFTDYPEQQQPVQLLQRSLAKGRLGHAYLFCGTRLDVLEGIARTLAKTLNCERRAASAADPSPAPDSCDECRSCRRIQSGNHPDVHWVRPESKSRVITIDQMRALMHEVQLKPTEAAFKVGGVVAADRLNVQAANAFLKTLEEPPPNSVLVLLSTEPQRLLETILSRCLRLNFAAEGARPLDAAELDWVRAFSERAAACDPSLLGRYRLLDTLLSRLSELRTGIEKALSAASPLETYEDVENSLKEKWEEELKAAVEAEYRRQRAGLVLAVQWWMRDVWMRALGLSPQHLLLPELATATEHLAQRLSDVDAMENLRVLERLQSLLSSNVQEALALEVSFLKLRV
jgi:DNA polymerase-3 subunit delta'